MSIWGIFTLEQDGQKSGGAMPPQSEKWRATGPPGPPSSAAYGQTLTHFCLFLLNVPLFEKSQPIFDKPNYPLKF